MSNDQQRGDKTLYDTTERIIENNQVHLRGKMVTGFSFSHELLGEGFYTAQVTVDRLSEVTDTIPIMVSERLIDVTQDYIGKYVDTVLKDYYWKPLFWSDSYFVATVSENSLDNVRAYIKNQ